MSPQSHKALEAFDVAKGGLEKTRKTIYRSQISGGLRDIKLSLTLIMQSLSTESTSCELFRISVVI